LFAANAARADQQNFNGLIISNMMMSIPAYNEYAEKVLMPAMDQKVLAEIKRLESTGKTDDARYMQLLIPAHYTQPSFVCPQNSGPIP
jgi:proline iminopeptidase